MQNKPSETGATSHTGPERGYTAGFKGRPRRGRVRQCTGASLHIATKRTTNCIPIGLTEPPSPAALKRGFTCSTGGSKGEPTEEDGERGRKGEQAGAEKAASSLVFGSSKSSLGKNEQLSQTVRARCKLFLGCRLLRFVTWTEVPLRGKTSC